MTYCVQACARALPVGFTDVETVVGFADVLVGAAEVLLALEVVGLAEAEEDWMDEGLPPPLLAPRARIFAAACSARTTM